MFRNYWSCSKLADKIRGTPKPAALGMGEWDQWNQEARDRHPVRFWIAETALDAIQKVITWPREKWFSFMFYVNNRWITKSHCLTAHPDQVKPGQWCDLSERILYAMFNELVNFVEVESAWHWVCVDSQAQAQYDVPWWRRRMRVRAWRSPKAGLEHLDWQCGLVMDESMGLTPDDQDYGKPAPQAQNAQEIRALYLWWTQEFLNREDPMDASGWSQYCEDVRAVGDGNLLFGFTNPQDLDPELRQRGQEASDLNNKIEQDYLDQEQEMLIRLIKVRKSLWT